MLDSLVQQFAGGGAGGMADSEVHSGLDALLGQAQPAHASGAIGEALQALGGSGFAQSVQSSAQHQGPNERGQIGSMLLRAVEQGGGSPGGILRQLGIGAQNPQAMSQNDLGSLAGYVAEKHGGALANLLGAGAAGGGGGSTESTVLHLLGTPMVRQVATNLARRFM
jgi:hypothetical protein